MENVALIELNSNEIKLNLIKVEKGGFFNIIDEVVETIKFGVELKKENLIKPQKIQECLKILKMYRKICDNNGIQKTYTVATNIFKDAKNQRSFFEEIYNNTGFNFNILTEEEEVKIHYLSVVNGVDVQKGVILNVDTETTNLIIYNRRNILNTITLPIGADSLANKFEDVSIPREKWDNMVKYVNTELESLDLELDPEISFIGNGSSFVSLGRMARKITKYPFEVENNYVVEKDTYNAVFEFVKDLDLDKSKKIKGISDERADVLASGFAIIKCILDKFSIPSVTISANDFKEGLIYNYIALEANDKPLGDMLTHSLENLNTFYGIEKSNSKHISALSLILFRQLKVLHKLPRNYVKPLRIASSLYDCGKRVKFENNTKCSFDIIVNSKINGVSHRDLLIAGFACMCQNLDNFVLSDWVKYKDILTEEDLDAVRKLGVIINLADQLDKSKTSAVKDICCDILGDSIIIKTIVEQNAEFDIMQGMKVANNFRKVFKRNLQII